LNAVENTSIILKLLAVVLIYVHLSKDLVVVYRSTDLRVNAMVDIIETLKLENVQFAFLEDNP
jgi:hypothetical protein